MDLKPTDVHVLEIAKAFKAFPDQKHGSIGEAFSYVVGFAPGVGSVWFMLLYDFFFWLGTVDWAAMEEAKAAH
jgi:hypothetical protein